MESRAQWARGKTSTCTPLLTQALTLRLSTPPAFQKVLALCACAALRALRTHRAPNQLRRVHSLAAPAQSSDVCLINAVDQRPLSISMCRADHWIIQRGGDVVWEASVVGGVARAKSAIFHLRL